MKLYLVPNGTTQERKVSARTAVRSLSSRFTCLADKDTVQWLALPGITAASPDEADMICAIGGDGTLLHAAHDAIASDKPLFGINLGNRGYLCAFHRDEADRVSEETVAALKEIPRTLLSFPWEGEDRIAINDLILAKEDFGVTIRLEAAIPEEAFHDAWQGDGLILSTPTGSSAYNASAGGPLLLARSGSFVLTPLCPVASSPSIVFSDSHAVSLMPDARPASVKPSLYADGTRLGTLRETLTVRKSDRFLRLMQR